MNDVVIIILLSIFGIFSVASLILSFILFFGKNDNQKDVTCKQKSQKMTKFTENSANDTAIQGFYFGLASSCDSLTNVPSTGWLFVFPGTLVTSIPTLDFPNAPSDISGYDEKILVIGGGSTVWDDSVYTQWNSTDVFDTIKGNGYTGVCWDWEVVGSNHTSDAFNSLMANASKNGLTNILTTTAEGPYSWSSDEQSTNIDWDCIDYFSPQLYGADGSMDPSWQSYVTFWKDGGGTNFNNVDISSPPDASKFLWSLSNPSLDNYVSFDTVDQVFPGTSGYITWCYDPYL